MSHVTLASSSLIWTPHALDLPPSRSLIMPPGFDKRAERRAVEKRLCEDSLAAFVRKAWSIIEPGQAYVHNWHIDFICFHLEAITNGVQIDGADYNRLLINVPPGMSKSLLLGVFWPAWEWGPRNMPHMRYVCASHNQDLAIRDGLRMRRLITSEWYQSHWGDRVVLTSDNNQKTKFENSATGFRQATAAGSITGARGTRVIIDDPHSVDGANSEQTRQSTIQWFLEAVPLRMDNPIKSVIVVIMQRLHEEDVSGVILSKNLGYDHIMLPMRYDPVRARPTKLGYRDPRTKDGELLFEARFPAAVVDRDERVLGPYAAAGQFQQEPTPRGGGIIRAAWWQLWDKPEYPPVEYILASLDTAYTAKDENDPSALTVWGVWSGADSNARSSRPVDRYGKPMELPSAALLSADPSAYVELPRAMLMYAWEEHLEVHELVEKVAATCRKFRVDGLIIENKAAGHSVAQELRRLFSYEDFSIMMDDPKGLDKMARLYSVQHLFAEGMIYAPDKLWAEKVIQQTAVFPRGKRDDLTDTVSAALRHLRRTGMLTRNPERISEVEQSMRHTGAPPPPLYYT